MNQTLRNLERRLVFERARLALVAGVDDLVSRWECAAHAGHPPIDPTILVHDLMVSTFYVPTTHRALLYLEKCHRKKSLPDRNELIHILLPW